MSNEALATFVPADEVPLRTHSRRGRSRPMSKEDRALVRASQAFASEDLRISWWVTLSTFSLLIASDAAALFLPTGPFRAAATLLTALLLARTFILYHDHMHGALLGDSRPARALLTVFGYLMMTPPAVWRYTHNYHHAHHGKELWSDVGTFPIRTAREWKALPPRQKLKYRIQRHPLAMMLGAFTIFTFKLNLFWGVQEPRKFWTSFAAVGLNWALHIAILSMAGWEIWLFGFAGPLAIAMGLGAFLFYSQHSFPDARYPTEPEEWSYVGAALRGSSFMDVSRVMHWFTGNIGYHHVHHLNPRIPFYRLPEAMSALPELQNPGRSGLKPSRVLECLRIDLWDPDRGRMIRFSDLGSTGKDEPESRH